GRGFPARGFLSAHQPWGHVGNSIDFVEAEGVAIRILRVPEDVVVLGRPSLRRARTVVVGPDDLVDERPATEDAVEHHLAVVHLAAVEMKEKTPGGFQDSVSLEQSRLEK